MDAVAVAGGPEGAVVLDCEDVGEGVGGEVCFVAGGRRDLARSAGAGLILLRRRGRERRQGAPRRLTVESAPTCLGCPVKCPVIVVSSAAFSPLLLASDASDEDINSGGAGPRIRKGRGWRSLLGPLAKLVMREGNLRDVVWLGPAGAYRAPRCFDATSGQNRAVEWIQWEDVAA